MNKQCKHGTFNDKLLDVYYDEFQEALDVCRNLSNCDGVYDEHCDGTNGFKLCPRGTLHHAMLPSCSYYKFGKVLVMRANRFTPFIT